MGPTLFIFFINSLMSSPRHSRIKLYADDVVLYTESKYPAVALRNLQEDLNILNNLCDSIGLTINHDKTKLVWYCAAHKYVYCSNRRLYVGGRQISEVESFSYLGASLDRTLSMKQFVSKMVNNTNFLLYKFARLRFLLSDEDATILFKQAVMPHFDYCSFLVDSCTEDHIKKLQVTQNRMLRCIRRVRVWEESTVDLHDLCEVPMLFARRKELLMSLVYSKTKKAPPPA